MDNNPDHHLSIIIPALNEADSLVFLLPELKNLYPKAEIIVVNDGSTDNTKKICAQFEVKSITHPYRKGNGAAVKSGARNATGDILVFMDADGQHRPEEIEPMLEMVKNGYEMVVGERSPVDHAGLGRRLANGFYNRFASWMTNQRIGDLTSGFRVVEAKKFKEFLHLLPNGFSYPTTITMAFMRAGYNVTYYGIKARQRRDKGTSHIQPLRDGLRFLLIIFKVGSLFSPLKIFVPFSFMTFALGISYYFYTFFTTGRFTNMSALLLVSSVQIFLIGLVSEQITTLLYQK